MIKIHRMRCGTCGTPYESRSKLALLCFACGGSTDLQAIKRKAKLAAQQKSETNDRAN